MLQAGPLDVGLSALDLRRRRIDLGPSLGDDRALSLDLAGEAGDGRVFRANARTGRLDGVLIVAIVDRSEQIALVDDLVVNHRNRGQVAHGLGGDDRGVRADIGVVGRNQEAPGDEIIVSRFAAVAQPGEDQNGHDESAQAGPLGRSRLSRHAGRWWMRESAGGATARNRKVGGQGSRHRLGRCDCTRLRDLVVIGHVRNPPLTES